MLNQFCQSSVIQSYSMQSSVKKRMLITLCKVASQHQYRVVKLFNNSITVMHFFLHVSLQNKTLNHKTFSAVTLGYHFTSFTMHLNQPTNGTCLIVSQNLSFQMASYSFGYPVYFCNIFFRTNISLKTLLRWENNMTLNELN